MVIFWLVLAILVAAVFVGLWLVAHSRLEKPPITLVEPLDGLIKSWQIARYTGQGSQVEAALKTIVATKNGQSKLENILPPLKGKLPQAVLLDSRNLRLVGEQKLTEEAGKKLSYIAGGLAEVERQLIVTATEKKELEKLEQNAGEHGFLALFVGRTAVHGAGTSENLENLQHLYLGAVLLEPQLDEKLLKQVTTVPPSKKIVSVLPAALAAWLAEKVGLSGPVYALKPTDSAEKFDQKVAKAAVVAGVDADARYRVVRTLDHDFRCQNYP